MKSQRTLSFDQKLWSKIEEQRGDVPRSRFIARILADVLDASQNEKNLFVKVKDPNEVKKVEED